MSLTEGVGSYRALPHRRGSLAIDLTIIGVVKGHPVRLLIAERAGGYPRDVQQAIQQLAEPHRLEQPVPDVPVLVAPAISEAGRALLRRKRIGYFDTSGSVYLDLPWALYWIDRPPPAGRPRTLRSVYRGSSAQVLHALLLAPTRPWHVTELAERAQVFVSTVHQVCTFLEQQLWMDEEGEGPRSTRVLRGSGTLLDAWATAHCLGLYRVWRRFRAVGGA